MWVDSNHAGNRLTRRSRTGVIIFVNKAPILWYSKGQNTVESSTFGSEFVAMRQTVDMNDSIRYKLRMFGIPITGATNVFADNMSVITNSTVPSSTISKSTTLYATTGLENQLQQVVFVLHGYTVLRI